MSFHSGKSLAVAALLSVLFLSPGQAQSPSQAAPEPVSSASVQALAEVLKLAAEDQNDAALTKINALLRTEPGYRDAYLVRGNIYMNQSQWGMAEANYQVVLHLDPGNIVASLSLAEIDFRQHLYESARSKFTNLATDPVFGDYAQYKIFLSDLLSGKETVAQKELDDFNEEHSKPSYYFGNGAWALFHHDPEEARGYFISAARIYPLKKIKLYTSDLTTLGYLPLPPPATAG